MALIVFYDTTELDKQQITNGLSETDHHWEYVDEKISQVNINPEAEIISVFVGSTVTREMIDAMPRLTLICCRSTGYNNIDLQAAKERNITVVNVPIYGNTTVAEYAFTLLLALTRKLPDVLESEHEPFVMRQLTGNDLHGKTFGVIGTGNIGQRAISIANGFGMNVLAYDAFPKDGLDSELHFSYVELTQLLQEADYVSIHVPYNLKTHHFMNLERLQAMKPGAILVNTARGALVDTPALIEVLNSGHLGGAALDVVEGEKLLNYEEELAFLAAGATPDDDLRHSIEISALKKMPNVIVSPHNAFNTVEAIGRINGTTTQNIIDFYNGHIPHQVQIPEPTTGKLVLLRHTESEWNASGTWTGIADVSLSDKGRKDLEYVGNAMKDLDLKIDVAFHTKLTRTEETLRGVCNVMGGDCEIIREDNFMERDYGEYTGQDKWKMKDRLGEEQWFNVRRGWDVEVPHGETLKDVYNRVVPAYQNKVLPLLKAGKNVLVVGHGNTFRALIKHLESISDEAIKETEMLINTIVVYEVDPETGLMTSVEKTDVETPTGKSELA